VLLDVLRARAGVAVAAVGRGLGAGERLVRLVGVVLAAVLGRGGAARRGVVAVGGDELVLVAGIALADEHVVGAERRGRPFLVRRPLGGPVVGAGAGDRLGAGVGAASASPDWVSPVASAYPSSRVSIRRSTSSSGMRKLAVHISPRHRLSTSV